MVTRSGLATMAAKPQTGVPLRKVLVPYGVCVHTTGSGVPKAAAQKRVDPLEVAVRYYTQPGSVFPHYVIGYAGQITQIADESLRARHAAIEGADRVLYQDGGWRGRVAAPTLARWKARWPEAKSPLDLFPPGSPNECYLGVEVIPSLGQLTDGGLFNDQQYRALGALLDDVCSRYGVSLQGSRILGHEDLEPLQRWTATGGWDPGFLRAKPDFEWSRIPRSAPQG